MNEVSIILVGAFCIALAVSLIVGGARTRLGGAAARTLTIMGGFLVLVVGLMLLTFGLPRVTTPFLLPASVAGALLLGWIVGYFFGEIGKDRPGGSELPRM